MKLSRRILLVSAMLMGVSLAGCASSPGGTPAPQSSAETPAAQYSAEPSTPQSSAGVPVSSTVTCEYVSAGVAAKPVDPPTTAGVLATGVVRVTLHMDAGDVVMTLNRGGAPCAVHSFESLVLQKFFDDTSCHRLVPDFVLQCGDPTGIGTGGPGYWFKDELSGSETYPYATVAMANSGPDTNGSQFFIVIGNNVQLPPSYVILGSVDSASMDVVESIAAQGVDPSDPMKTRPAEGAHISAATLS